MLNIFLQKGVHLTHGPHFGHARCKKYHILVSAMVQIQNLEWSSFSPPILSFSNWFKTRRTLLESWSSLTNLQNVYRSLKEKDKTCLYHPFFFFSLPSLIRLLPEKVAARREQGLMDEALIQSERLTGGMGVGVRFQQKCDGFWSVAHTSQTAECFSKGLVTALESQPLFGSGALAASEAGFPFYLSGSIPHPPVAFPPRNLTETVVFKRKRHVCKDS